MNPAKRAEFFARLQAANPAPTTELEYGSPFQLLIAVLLSAQATDVSVNKATRRLFADAPTPAMMAALGEERLAEYIKTIGLFRTKARNAIQELKACAKTAGCTFLVLMQRSSDGMKRFNPRPMKSDVYGGQSAVQPFDAIFFLYRGEYHLQEQLKVAADDKERAKIEARFAQQYGDDIEGTAEIGALKVRFGTTTQRRKVRFIPEFTRYESMYSASDEHQGGFFE